MFQSIKYVNHTCNNKNNLFHYTYEIIDSDFISISSTAAVGEASVLLADCSAATLVIKEYERRNYTHQEIIKNLFLLNIFMLKQNWYNNINQIFEYQNKYLSKKYFTESNFHEKYYDDLVKYTKKMIVAL